MPTLDEQWGFQQLMARKRSPRQTALRRPRTHEIEGLEGNEYPLLAMPDTVVFPNLVTPLFLGRDRPAFAVEAAEAMKTPLLIVAQRDPEVEDPDISDLYSIGTAVEIGRVLRMPDGSTTVLVQGLERVRIIEEVDTDPYWRVRGIPLYEDERHDMASEALMRAVLALFEKAVNLNPNLPEDAYVAAMNEKAPGSLADLVAHVLDLELEQRQELLETLDVNVRLQRLSIMLGQELDVLELEDRIQTQVQQELDKSQREYYLREQLRAIQTELGEDDETQRDVARPEGEAGRQRDAGGRARQDREGDREVGGNAAHVARKHDRAQLPGLACSSLPWSTATDDNLDIGACRRNCWTTITTACRRPKNASWNTSPCASWRARR